MNQDFRMGWPAALNCIPLEPRKAHVTPNRSTRNADDAWESDDWTHVGMHTVQQSINGAATCQAFGEKHVAPEAAPPSTTDKPQGVFKAGDRVRVRPGYIEGDPYAPGTIVRIADFVYVQHDAPLPGKAENDLAGWCAGNLVLDETPQADAGWIQHDGGPCPVPAGTRIAAIKQKRSGVCEYGSSQSADSLFWEPIVAYRIVKEPA